MNILLLGKSGMMGGDLLVCLENSGFSITRIGHNELNFEFPLKIPSTIAKLGPDAVVNCAAYTAVDLAEKEPSKAFTINRDAPKALAIVCHDLKIPLVHISTDYVFNGKLERPYTEEDPPSPISTYGKSKWEGERAIRDILENHIIVRTSWLYSKRGKNFVKTILQLAHQKSELRIVNDQFGSPTWTKDLAEAVATILRQISLDSKKVIWGTYHYCGKGETTWHGFAQAIVEEASRYETLRTSRIVPISTREYPTPAERPKYSTLDCRKIEENFGVNIKPWRESLRFMLKEFYS